MSDLPAVSARPGRILTVCTGNICRSPVLERVLQTELDQRWGPDHYQVGSAGTHALVGYPMDERAAQVLASFGGTDEGFRARRLTAKLISQADLVLTATTEHRAMVLREYPRALRHTFTFREFGALAEASPLSEVGLQSEAAAPSDASSAPEAQLGLAPADRLREVAGVLLARRGPDVVREPDIIDPYRQPDEIYAQMRAEIAAALPAVLSVLT